MAQVAAACGARSEDRRTGRKANRAMTQWSTVAPPGHAWPENAALLMHPWVSWADVGGNTPFPPRFLACQGSGTGERGTACATPGYGAPCWASRRRLWKVSSSMRATTGTAAASWSRTCGRRGQREADAACAVDGVAAMTPGRG